MPARRAMPYVLAFAVVALVVLAGGWAAAAITS
jgi:hypothetical protein